MFSDFVSTLRSIFLPSDSDAHLHVLSAVQRRQTLRFVLALGAVASTLITVQTALLYGLNPFLWGNVGMSLLLFALLWLLARGQILAASYITLWGILGYLLVATFAQETEDIAAYLAAYTLLVMMAGLFLSPRQALVYFWVTLGLFSAGVALQSPLARLLGATPRFNSLDVAIMAIVLTVGLVVQRMFVTLLSAALQREQQTGQTLAERNEALEETSAALTQAQVVLEQEVAVRTARLRESEALYRAVIHNAPDGVVVFDTVTGRFIEANEEASNIMGLSRSAMLAIEPATWVSRNPVDPTVPTAQEIVKQVLEGDLHFIEIPVRRPDGSVAYVEVSFATLPSARHPLIIGSLRDITARRAAEERRANEHQQLQKIMSALPTGVTVAALADPGDVLWANGQIADLLGYDAAEMIGRPIRGFYADPLERDRVRRRIAMEGSVHGYVIQARRRDGALIWIRLFVESVVWEGTPALLAFVENISELKDAEETLRQAQRIESLGVLAGGVAHDFNNLLVAMLAEASLAEERLADDHPAHANLTRVTRAAEQAAALTRQLLAYSGRGQFEVRALDLNQLVVENARLLRAAIPSTVTVDLALAPTLPLVAADAGQLQQVAMNLVLNAVEALPEREGKIGVATGSVTLDREQALHPAVGYPLRPGQYVTLAVEDDGNGIDLEASDRIFDPFFTTKSKGRGLGLAAVIGIVRGHRGGITVSAGPGGGTVFTVYLPAERAEAGTPVPRPDAPLAAAGATQKAVLLIDDEDLVRDAVCDVLASAKIVVVAVADGRSGIDLYADDPAHFGLVILDLSMPGMSGEETFQALRAINPAVRVLISSGYSEQEAMRQFVGRGDVAFLKKPYRFDVLLSAVGAQLAS